MFTKPHLATDAKLEKLEFPIYVQFKIDGVRAIVHDGKCTGRSLKAHKNEALTEYFSQPCFEGFDMELGATYPNDSDLCRLTTSLTGTIKGVLPKFAIVFDYLGPETADLEYSERMESLSHCVSALDDATPYSVAIYISKQHLILSMEELMVFYEDALKMGYEGLVIRKQEGKHKNGRCTVNEGNYLRIKPTGDSEGLFLACEEAMENQNEAVVNALGHTERSSHKENKIPKGMIGSIWVKDLKTGAEVKLGPGTMSHEQRTYFFKHQDELATKIIKYKFLNTGQKDKPRHARFFSFRNREDL